MHVGVSEYVVIVYVYFWYMFMIKKIKKLEGSLKATFNELSGSKIKFHCMCHRYVGVCHSMVHLDLLSLLSISWFIRCCSLASLVRASWFTLSVSCRS